MKIIDRKMMGCFFFVTFVSHLRYRVLNMFETSKNINSVQGN